MSLSTTPKITSRIVRCCQGAWRWQTPYELVWYSAVSGADGVLRWQRDSSTRKMTFARAAALAGHKITGGIHGRPVVENRDVIYSNDNH